jgi:hypothetical protein
MVAEVLDPLERESLMKLFATAGNVKIGDGTPLDQIDWNAALRGIHAPVLTEEQIEEQRQQVLENKKEAQEMFQETQAKAAQNNGGPPQAQSRNGQQQKPPGQKLQARLDIMEHMTNGGAVPVMLTLDDVVGIAENSPADVIDVGLETQPVSIEMQGRRPRRGRKGRATSAKASNPEFEEKHKRDASGKFAKKEEEGDGEEAAQDDRDKLDSEPWPGARTQSWPDGRSVEVKGVVTLDGIEYTVLDGVSKEELLAVHEVNARSYERGSEFLGREMQKIPTAILPVEPDEGLMAFAYQNAFVETPNEDNGMVYVDVGLAKDHPDALEAVMFHENLHAQPRTQRPWTNPDKGNGGLFAEEAYNGIVELGYAEKHNLPIIIGWDDAVSPIAKAAQERGWDKQKLYSYAIRAHEIDGELYRNITELLLEGTGVELVTHHDALDSWWPGWEESTSVIYTAYGKEQPARRQGNWPSFEYGDWGR